VKKPEFPPARPIREDFLPEPMKNYRIKKVTENGLTKYYPQVRVLFWWHNLFSLYDHYDGFRTLDEAQKKLCYLLQKPVVEFIEFDPKKDCVKLPNYEL
jgi:hypothetical protein